MQSLLILNEPPYGSLKSYNAIRLANALAKRRGSRVRVFLMGDAVACAKKGQRTPLGNYNFERMFQSIVRSGGEIAACLPCLEMRGILAEDLAQGCSVGNLDLLSEWIEVSEKVMVF